jgi:hydrogenase nickel incorporation protein HypA/HybF
MHELSIAQGIIEIVEQHVPPDERDMVRAIRLKVGEMSGVVPDSLEFCFTALIAQTPLEKARLEIEQIPFTMRCASCESVFGSEQGLAVCPSCGGIDTKLVTGSELNVVDIELEDRPVEAS